MGKLFLASRSSLGTVVLCMPDDGPARPLKPVWVEVDGSPCPFDWGPQAPSTLHLAEALTGEAFDTDQVWPEQDLSPLARRLAAYTADVWVMTVQDILASFKRSS